jgi:hypothetical protein
MKTSQHSSRVHLPSSFEGWWKVGEGHPYDGFAAEIGEARLLEDARAEVKPTAESMVWRFNEAGDEKYLDITWISGGEMRFDTYLSSNVDMRYVYLVDSSVDEEMTA